MKRLFTLAAGLMLFLSANSQTTWNIDKSHTNIRFTAIHMMVSEVDGNFNAFEGKVVTKDDSFVGAEVEFSADVASVDTGNERRDGHLKSDDFFNAEKFPKITFKGTIEKEGEKYYLVGNLTMRDVTKPIKFETRFNGTVPGRRGRKAGFKVLGSVKRFEYGLKYDSVMDSGGLMVSDEIDITCNVELNEVTEG